MTPGLSASAIVGAWELAEARGPLDRALLLLWAAGAADEPAALPLAERDRRLLALRRASFGDGLACVVDCPACGAALELELSSAELADALPAAAPEVIEAGGTRVELRPLDSRDLAAAASLPESDVAGFLRARACGREALPEAVAAEVDARLEAREALTELTLSLACAACGAAWRDSLDVGAHVWSEVDQAARRMMGEAAAIAAAFGWSEAAILAMSDARRRVYLELARGG